LLDDKTAADFVQRWKDLYGKYKEKCAFASTYAKTNDKEFFAESMVLFMDSKGAGLPADVLQYFNDLLAAVK